MLVTCVTFQRSCDKLKDLFLQLVVHVICTQSTISGTLQAVVQSIWLLLVTQITSTNCRAKHSGLQCISKQYIGHVLTGCVSVHTLGLNFYLCRQLITLSSHTYTHIMIIYYINILPYIFVILILNQFKIVCCEICKSCSKNNLYFFLIFTTKY